MELRHLRYFVAVAEHLSFTAAAESLGVSQPPLSQQIRALETELGTPVFERSSRRVALTRAGQDFLTNARAILVQVQEAADRARIIGNGTAGIMNVGLTGSMLVGPLGQLIRLFGRRHPDVELRIHEMAPDDQIAALKARRIDLTFLRSPPLDAGLRSELAWREEIGVVLPHDHPLASRSSLPLTILRDEPFISFRLKDSRFANDIMSACMKAGIVPQVSQQAVEAASLMNLVAAGFGVALVPEFVSRMKHPNVVSRPLDPPALAADVYTNYLARPAPVVETFLDLMRKEVPLVLRQIRRDMAAAAGES